jgi:hypothetical protein
MPALKDMLILFFKTIHSGNSSKALVSLVHKEWSRDWTNLDPIIIYIYYFIRFDMVPNDEQDMNSFNKISTCGSRQQTGLKKKKKIIRI